MIRKINSSGSDTDPTYRGILPPVLIPEGVMEEMILLQTPGANFSKGCSCSASRRTGSGVFGVEHHSGGEPIAASAEYALSRALTYSMVQLKFRLSEKVK